MDIVIFIWFFIVVWCLFFIGVRKFFLLFIFYERGDLDLGVFFLLGDLYMGRWLGCLGVGIFLCNIDFFLDVDDIEVLLFLLIDRLMDRLSGLCLSWVIFCVFLIDVLIVFWLKVIDLVIDGDLFCGVFLGIIGKICFFFMDLFFWVFIGVVDIILNLIYFWFNVIMCC